MQAYSSLLNKKNMDKKHDIDWLELDNVLRSSIEYLGDVVKFSRLEWECQYELVNCFLYFAYQKPGNYVEVVIGDLSEEYGSNHRLLLSPSFELYLTGNLEIFSQHRNRGPEFVNLLNGKRQPLGYIARLLESDVLKAFANDGFKSLPNFFQWHKANEKYVYNKIMGIHSE